MKQIVLFAAVVIVGASACEQPAILIDGRTPEQLALDQLLYFQGVIVAGQFRDDVSICEPPTEPPEGDLGPWAPLYVATFDITWAGPPVLVDGVETQVFETGQAVPFASTLPLEDAEQTREVYISYALLGFNPGFECAGNPIHQRIMMADLSLTRPEIESALEAEPRGQLLTGSLRGHWIPPAEPEETAP